MNSLLKRVLSGAVSVSTVLSALPGVTPVSAENGISPQAEITRHLTVEFLGSGETPQKTSTQRDAYFKQSDVGASAGNEFWVGVAVDNVNDLELFTKGIYSLEIAFEYNSDYVIPYYKSSSPSTQDSANEWQEALELGNNDIWSSEYYDIVSVHNSEYDTFATDRENITKTDRQNEPWRTCVVSVASRETTLNSENAVFYELDTADKQYLLKLPFKLVDVPEDTSTEVLSLVRAPETFNIGSGTDGTDPYASWQATVEDPDDQTNLKNLFGFERDISLFGIGGTITDIVPFTRTTPPEADPPEPVVTKYTLYQSNELTDDGFLSDHKEYYVSVPNDVNELRLGLKASAAPTVKANGEEVSVSESDEEDFDYETDVFALTELDKETNGGFSNTVTVSDGTTTYTIYIRRLLKPKIVLNYGNSPVGMIMNDDETYDSDDAKQAAIDDFKSNHKFSGVTKDLTYYPDAWTSYKGKGADGTDYNGDEDPYAMFVFQRESFKDVGFTAYDSTGEEVQDTDVSISLTMKSYKGGFARYDDTDNAVDIQATATGNGHEFTEFINYDIRPDVYDMTYTFEDPVTDSSVTQTRKVIAISKRGDVYIDANNTVNNNDATEIMANVTHFTRETANSLYKFRIADTVTDDNLTINNNDATEIMANVTRGLPQFYNKLPN